MHAKEALHVLGLGADATQEEIKAAFRDLVKVWHPDRFGGDSRLRAKAERRLQDINAAYAMLRDGVPAGPANTASRSSSRAPASSPIKTIETQVPVAYVMLYSLAGVLFAAVVGCAWFLLQQFRSPTNSGSAATAVQAVPSTPEASVAGVMTERRVLPPKEFHPMDQTKPQFRVLTETVTAQVEAHCAGKRRAGNLRAYEVCVQSQLDWMKKYRQEGSSLTSEEQDSLASTCSGDRGQQRDAEYARCVVFYKEELEASADRPKLETVNEDDRASMRKACATHKTEGPATYDRCLMRMVRLLTQSR